MNNPALQSILNMQTVTAPQQPVQSTPNNMETVSPMGLGSGLTPQQTFIPSYQAGGMIGAGGMPEPMGVGLAPQGQTPQGSMTPQMLEMHVNQFATQHPQQIAQIRAVIMELMQTGELTQQELNMIIQLATVAAQNPEMYPYVRNFAIQQGIATEQDLPQQYDQGLVFVLLLAARAIQADVGGQNMMQGGTPMMAGNPDAATSQVTSGVIPSMANGGGVPLSKKSDGSVLINAHEGEYVIPAHVVKMKGKEFFDSLVEKYKA